MSPENRVHPYRHAFNRRREEALNELFLERTLQAQVPDTTLPVVNNAEENNKYTRFLFLFVVVWIAVRVIKYYLFEALIMLNS
ncbi:hypothetical protein BDP27DRAFT_1419455 [Rhodocollybia butyracea]|uniref:Uncharacterized protein n=1 Tax=Rhodocollybia butyracea TaxID=206335 RepID=A0A9P5PZL5_9AGAR|nr:hypothetical protein BDP27DRAFT_1419455 [Rhodocollybia butyracea]